MRYLLTNNVRFSRFESGKLCKYVAGDELDLNDAEQKLLANSSVKVNQPRAAASASTVKSGGPTRK